MIASWICHRIAERSFTYAGSQSLLCGRCSGLYTAFLVVVVICFLRTTPNQRFSPSSTTRALALFGVLVMTVDVATSTWGLRASTNGIRTLTGFIAGAGLGLLLIPLTWRDLFARFTGGGRHATPISMTVVIVAITSLATALAGWIVGRVVDVLATLGVFAYLATAYCLALRALRRLAALAGRPLLETAARIRQKMLSRRPTTR